MIEEDLEADSEEEKKEAQPALTEDVSVTDLDFPMTNSLIL